MSPPATEKPGASRLAAQALQQTLAILAASASLLCRLSRWRSRVSTSTAAPLTVTCTGWAAWRGTVRSSQCEAHMPGTPSGTNWKLQAAEGMGNSQQTLQRRLTSHGTAYISPGLVQQQQACPMSPVVDNCSGHDKICCMYMWGVHAEDC